MNTQVDIWYSAVVNSLEAFLSKIAVFAPSLIAAVITLIVGYLVAKIARSVVNKIARRVGVDKISEAAGIDTLISKFDQEATFSSFIAATFFWGVMLVFVVTATETLGLPHLSETVDQMIMFLPKIFAATLILLFGLLVANVAKKAVYEGATSTGLDFAGSISQAVYLVLVILSVSLAIGELEIETALLNSIVSIVLGALGIASAISLGLGSTKSSENILNSIYIKEHLSAGDEIELTDGRKGTIEMIGPVSTSVKCSDGLFIIENKDLLGGVKKLSK